MDDRVEKFRDELNSDWRTFKDHAPVGAYLPVGQIDGDCKTCGGTWPCGVWFAALKRAQKKAMSDGLD